MLYKAGMLLGGGSSSSSSSSSSREVWLGTESCGLRMFCVSPRGRVSSPELDISWVTAIGYSGLEYAFYNCTGLTGSVSFPKLTTVGSSGLDHAFYGCKGVTAVHFPAALSSNSECTASNMGCTNATVYFDL